MEPKTISRKDAILEIARTILVEEGHHQLTMRRVTETSGMKLTALQQHYPTKGNLVGALIEKSSQIYHQTMLGLIRSIRTEESQEAIGRLFAVYQNELVRRVNDQLLALSVQDGKLKKRYDELYAQFWDTVTAEMQLFDPQADEEVCRSRAAMVISMLDGLESFVGSVPLKTEQAAIMQTRVVELVRRIAQGQA